MKNQPLNLEIRVLTRQDMLNCLKTAPLLGSGFLSRMKTLYRPYICPFEKLLALIPPGSQVFDIGCGQGMFMYLVAKFAQPQRIFGIDVDDRALISARRILDHGEFQIPCGVKVFDGKTFPEIASTYDYFTLIDVLHHVAPDKQREFLANLFKVIPENGRLLIKDMNAEDKPHLLMNRMHDLILAKQWVFERTAKEVRGWCQEFGKIEAEGRVRTGPYSHFWILLRKSN